VEAGNLGKNRQCQVYALTTEESAPGPTCQAAACDLDIVDDFCFDSFAFGQPAIHQMGETIMRVWLDVIINKNKMICQHGCSIRLENRSG